MSPLISTLIVLVLCSASVLLANTEQGTNTFSLSFAETQPHDSSTSLNAGSADVQVILAEVETSRGLVEAPRPEDVIRVAASLFSSFVTPGRAWHFIWRRSKVRVVGGRLLYPERRELLRRPGHNFVILRDLGPLGLSNPGATATHEFPMIFLSLAAANAATVIHEDGEHEQSSHSDPTSGIGRRLNSIEDPSLRMFLNLVFDIWPLFIVIVCILPIGLPYARAKWCQLLKLTNGAKP